MKIKRLYLFFLILSSILNFSCSNKIINIETKNPLLIVAFGDSLTRGEGSQEEYNFPSILENRLGIEVINSGVNGDSTKDALVRVKEDVIKYKPTLTIVEFGANDFFQKVPKPETERNLEEIVRAIQGCGSIVIIIGVRLDIFKDDYNNIFKRVAKKTKSIYISDILNGIITNPSLKSDEIHPNSEGYKIMSERILKAVKPLMDKNMSLKNQP